MPRRVDLPMCRLRWSWIIIGGIILGIWGVRSVVVQTELPDVTLIDLILAFVMLVLMLALSVRAARYFYDQSRLRR